MIVDMIAWAVLFSIMFATCNRRRAAGKNKVSSKNSAAKVAAEKAHSKGKKKETGPSQEELRKGALLIESDQEEDNTKHLSAQQSEQDGTYEDVDINLVKDTKTRRTSRTRPTKGKSKSREKRTKKLLKEKPIPAEVKTTPVRDRKTCTSPKTNDVMEPKTATANSPAKRKKSLGKLNKLFRTMKSPQRILATTQEESDQVPGALAAEGQAPLQSLTLNKTSTQRSEMVQGEQLEHLNNLTENQILATQRTKTLLPDDTLPVEPTLKVNE